MGARCADSAQRHPRWRLRLAQTAAPGPRPEPRVPNLSRRRWIIRGRVQGVGFRWFVMHEAQPLKLAGFAQNLADGSVEVVSEGSDRALDALETALRRGPSHARVDTVERLQVPLELELPRPFDIR
ncbi:MAG TPA: acylphosphatase [Gemmatimonadales bacterium]